MAITYTFICACGRTCRTKNADRQKCQKCCTPITQFKVCNGCGELHQSKTQPLCRKCHVKSQPKSQKMRRAVRKLCDDPMIYYRDIKILKVKSKRGLLNQIDCWRACHIFMDIVCNENRYSGKSPQQQAIGMIDDLWDIVEWKSTNDLARMAGQ